MHSNAPTPINNIAAVDKRSRSKLLFQRQLKISKGSIGPHDSLVFRMRELANKLTN